MSEKPDVIECLKRYLELDKEIQELEGKNVRKMYKEIKDKIDDVAATIKTLETEFGKKKQKTEKEKADVDNLLKEFKQIDPNDEKMAKEKAEYMEALSEQQALEQQLNGVKDQKKDLEKNLSKYEGDKTKLDNAQKEQDELLEKVFKGSYGSDKENDLERKLDILLEKQQLIKAADYRWKNGRILLDHAWRQFDVAVKKWNECGKALHERQNSETLFVLATEARNNLMAAKQNISNAQKYLSNIEFPYCKNDELEVLQTAINNIYTDVMHTERIEYASKCYNVTYKRCGALVQWFDQVINQRIKVDLAEANKTVREMSKDLRQERIRLMQELAGNDGQSVQLQDYEPDQVKDDEEEPELVGLVQTEESDKMEQVRGPTPWPKGQLPPPPSNEDIFGNVEELKQKFVKQETESKKTQEFNRARIQQGLEEKLTARRNRRNRTNISDS